MVTRDQKPIINTHKKREMNPNIALKIVIKSQQKTLKEEETRTIQNNRKTTLKMIIENKIKMIIVHIYQ